MAVLEPRLAILDETDSGLDIDALRIVADGVNALRSPDRAMLVITHYQRLLNYIVPDSSTCWRRPHRASRAARSWRSSSRRRATPGSRRQPAPRAHDRMPDARSLSARTSARLDGAGPGAVARAARARRCERFAELGFPTTRAGGVEVHQRRAARAASRSRSRRRGGARRRGATLAAPARAARRRIELVFVNGRFAPALSSPAALPPGVAGRSLAAALRSARRAGRAAPRPLRRRRAAHAFAALNTAFMQRRRVRLRRRAARSVAAPIHLSVRRAARRRRRRRRTRAS